MKLMPRSMAVRTMRRLSCSSTFGSPRCQPPIPIGDTRSLVLPSVRYCVAGSTLVSDLMAAVLPDILAEICNGIDVDRHAGRMIERCLELGRHRSVLREPRFAASSISGRLDGEQLLGQT